MRNIVDMYYALHDIVNANYYPWSINDLAISLNFLFASFGYFNLDIPKWPRRYDLYLHSFKFYSFALLVFNFDNLAFF